MSVGLEVTEKTPVYEQSVRTGIVAVKTESEYSVSGNIVEATEAGSMTWTTETDNLYTSYHSELKPGKNYFWISALNTEYLKSGDMVNDLQNFFNN